MTFDLIISNPPYLAEEEWRSAQPEVREWEPHLAMVAGDRGLAVIRGLVEGLEEVLRPGGWVGLEVGRSQATPSQGCCVSDPDLQVWRFTRTLLDGGAMLWQSVNEPREHRGRGGAWPARGRCGGDSRRGLPAKR